jgi:hypothetical protein
MLVMFWTISIYTYALYSSTLQHYDILIICE